MTLPVRRWIAVLFVAVAALHLAISLPRSTLRVGDSLQVVLPLVGGACAAARGDFGEYLGRFAGLMVVVHGLKNTLGTAPINVRPTGGANGFPSGHTASAVYGASYIVRSCGAFVPYLGTLAVIGAGFVAGSRIESKRHDLRQAVGGAIGALVADRALRRPDSRRALRRLAIAAWVRLRRLHRQIRVAAAVEMRRLRRQNVALFQAE